MNITFALLAFLTIMSWLVVGYCVYLACDNKFKKQPPNQLLGHVNKITSDENGVYVDGTLNEAGKKLVGSGTMTAMSAGFRVSHPPRVEKGTRIINDATLHSVSLDAEPGPYGGVIETVEQKTWAPNPLSVDGVMMKSAADPDKYKLQKPPSAVDYVGTQPEELCKHGYPTDEHHNAEGRCSRNPDAFH